MKKLVNKEIKLSNIRISKQHWSRKITEEDVADLADSIADWGQFHQLLVRPVGKNGTMYELLSGKRRYLALKEAGLKSARCAVVKCEDDKTAKILSLEENFKTLKPAQREWQRGLKELKDLLAEKIEKEEKRREAREAQLKPKKKSQKKGPGRPKDPNRAATKKVAEVAKVSESTARRAIKREEDLVPSALLALNNERITAEQADYLANMPAERQRAELGIMLSETQSETRSRRNKTKNSRTECTNTEIVRAKIERINSECALIKESADDILEFMDGKSLDYEELKKMGNNIKPAISCLEELLQFLND